MSEQPITNVEDAVAALGALPVPVGPEPQSRSVLGRAREALGARMSKDDLRLVLENTIAYAAGLEAERHSTNESLDDAVQALRLLNTQRGDVDQLVEAAEAAGEDCVDVGDLITALALGTDDERAAADGITRRFAPSQVLREDEPTPKCRCSEPDVDPYACEAEDCTHEFSELNPFDGGSGPVEGHDAKVSRACGCGFRTTVWHVADGSAEAELHEHVVRVHGGVYPTEAGGAS